jgi:hypothetical protein
MTTNWKEEFDEEFVVDENSAEHGEDGEMKWSEDTKLIADFIDGKTLTAKHIKDFISQALLNYQEEIKKRVEGMKIKDEEMSIDADFGKCDAYNDAIANVLSILNK